MSLIQEVGVNYINEMCAGACFYYEDRLVMLREAGEQFVSAQDMDTGGHVRIPAEFFTGWKVFSSQPAGYRRLGEHVVGYCTKQNSTRRGLRPEGIRVDYTPASVLLARLQTAGVPRTDNKVKVAAMIRPTFDILDEALPRLLAGTQLSVVLNENIVIETAVNQRADSWYTILFKQAVIGKLNRHGHATWTDPENSLLIPSLQVA